MLPIEAFVIGTSTVTTNVGNAICKGLSRAGHETKFGQRDPIEPVAEAAKWGEVIILAIPHENANDAIEKIN